MDNGRTAGAQRYARFRAGSTSRSTCAELWSISTVVSHETQASVT